MSGNQTQPGRTAPGTAPGIARLLVHHPSMVLGGSLFVAALLGLAGARFQVDQGADAILEGDQRTRDAYALVEDALKDQVVAVISMECDRVFDRFNLLLMRDLSEALLNEPGVIDVKSFTHSSIPSRSGFGFNMLPFLGGEVEDLDDEALAERERFSTEHPLVRNLMISADGRHATIGVTYEPDHFDPERDPPVDLQQWRERMDEILAEHTRDGVRFTWLSLPSAQHELLGLLDRDLRLFIMALTVVLAVWLVAFFRTWRLLLFGIGCVVLFAPLMPGLLALFQIRPGVFSLSVFPLLGAILLTMLAHVTHAFRNALEHGSEPPDSALEALMKIGRSTTLAAVTTAIGMGSFAFSGLSQAREFGLLGAVGVLLALLVVLGPGISLLVLIHRGLHQPLNVHNPGRIRLPERWREPALIGLLAVFALAGAGWWQRPTEVRITSLLPEQSHTRQAAETLEANYGGIQFLKIGIDSGRDGGIGARDFLDYLLRLEQQANKMDGVSATYSYAAVMAMMNQVWNDWDPESYHLPDSGLLLGVFDTALRNANFPFTHALHDDDRRIAWFYVRLRDMSATETVRLVRDLELEAARDVPAGVNAQLADGLHRFAEAEARIEQGQWRTMGATLLVTGAFLALWWRSLRLALVAMAFVAVPTVSALGLAGWLSVPLNSITFMVAALVLGIALDDVVHWLGYWREQIDRGTAADVAVRHTQEVKGHPILLTSVLLVAVFLAFGIMHFPPLIHFGWTAAAALAAAVALLLLGLPWWMRGRNAQSASTAPPCTSVPASQ